MAAHCSSPDGWPRGWRCALGQLVAQGFDRQFCLEVVVDTDRRVAVADAIDRSHMVVIVVAVSARTAAESLLAYCGGALDAAEHDMVAQVLVAGSCVPAAVAVRDGCCSEDHVGAD